MKHILLPAVLSLAVSAASAHIAIDPPVAEAGATWRGVVRVGHGCDASATTAIEVNFPAGVSVVNARAGNGWQVALTPQRVTWTASQAQGLATKEAGEFPLELRVPAAQGQVWLAAVQHCGAVAIDWSQVPAQGTSTEGMKTPAVSLKVVSGAEAAAWRMRPSVDGAWARASLPGQPSSGAYMRITAKEPTQLVAVTSPLASAAVHEMKMEGNVMRMRPAGALDLSVGRAFELKPGSYHVMLQDLKQPLVAGSSLPMTLVFRNANGVESRTELRVPVLAQPPQGGAAGHAGHTH